MSPSSSALNRSYPKNLNIRERRKKWRFPVNFEASLWPKNGSSHKINVIDISVDGAGIEPPKPIQVGESGVLRIDTNRGSLRLPYAVVRSLNMNGLLRVGLSFYLMDSVRLQLASILDGMHGV